jgi:hypothetical protein
MTEKTKLRGWKSLPDGTRVEMTEAEVAAAIEAVEQNKQRVAETYPDTYSALRAFIDADQRMHQLGWRHHFAVLEESDEVAVIEIGSTGLFKCVWRNGLFHGDDFVRRAGADIYWKRIAELTPQEVERMAETSASNAAAAEAHMRAMANLASLSGTTG